MVKHIFSLFENILIANLVHLRTRNSVYIFLVFDRFFLSLSFSHTHFLHLILSNTLSKLSHTHFQA